MRTVSALPCLIGVPNDRWSNGAYVVYPIQAFKTSPISATPTLKKCPKNKHVIHLSINWSKAIQNGRFSSSADIARQMGLSPGRVCQILWLANLDERVVKHLLALHGQNEVKQFSEKRLRKITQMPTSEQFAAFIEMLQSS